MICPILRSEASLNGVDDGSSLSDVVWVTDGSFKLAEDLNHWWSMPFSFLVSLLLPLEAIGSGRAVE